MAYGVKYRLIFADVLGNGKKVEILKKDYTGDVLPMIGGANPVQISWRATDDFYKPIIGSQCTLSLLVTDSVSYDDFYRFDEREYKIVVYYAKSQGEIFEDRVVADGGSVENVQCIDDSLSNFLSFTEQFEERVVNEGGEVESLSCISNSITDGNYYEWGEYWSGFIVVDRYKEKLTTPPFGISLNAFDGLGTLNNFFSPVVYGSGYIDNNIRIAQLLDHLDLDLPINFVHDTYIYDSPTNKRWEQTRLFDTEFSQIKGDYDVPSAKEQLEFILQNYNMRIFQSYNQWWIVEATNVFDNYVKDEIYNELQATGTTPTGIRDRITSKLNAVNNEYLEVYKYDSAGTYDETIRIPVLYNNNKHLKAVKNSLSREYIEPIKSVTTISQYETRKDAFYNSGFEFNTFGWTIYGSPDYAEIATDEISFKGTKSLKLTSSAPTTGQTLCFSRSESFNPQNQAIQSFGVALKYFVKAVSSTTTSISTDLQFELKVQWGSNTRYYYYPRKIWLTTPCVTYNKVNSLVANRFINFSTGVEQDINFGSDTYAIVTLEIYNILTTSSDYVTTYFDNVELKEDVPGPETEAQNFVSNLTDVGVNTKDKKYKRRPTETAVINRTRDRYFVSATNNKYLPLQDLANQNIANDFRSFVSRYSGTFRNLISKPLSMHNKIWFYWTGIETDPQTTIIDGLKYNLKSGEMTLNSHLPNNDDDTTLENIIR